MPLVCPVADKLVEQVAVRSVDFNAIETGGPTRTPIREGAKTLDLALAVVRSAEERREIAL